MKRLSIALVVPPLMAVLAFGAAAGDAVELPVRKAGRWEMKTTWDEGNGPREGVVTMCVDADKERTTAAASAADHKQSCKKYDVSKAGDTFTVDADCHMNERDVVSRTEMSGDFQKTFKVKIESTTSGIHGAQSVSVKRTIVQEGKYVSDACGDLKAGEAMGSDGKKVLVQ